jgi:hypothetical protein
VEVTYAVGEVQRLQRRGAAVPGKYKEPVVV